MFRFMLPPAPLPGGPLPPLGEKSIDDILGVPAPGRIKMTDDLRSWSGRPDGDAGAEPEGLPAEHPQAHHVSACMGLGPLCGSGSELCWDGSVSVEFEDGRDITCRACRAVWLADRRAEAAEARVRELEQQLAETTAAAAALRKERDAARFHLSAESRRLLASADEIDNLRKQLDARPAAPGGPVLPPLTPGQHLEIYCGPPRAPRIERLEQGIGAAMLVIEREGKAGMTSSATRLARDLLADALKTPTATT